MLRLSKGRSTIVHASQYAPKIHLSSTVIMRIIFELKNI